MVACLSEVLLFLSFPFFSLSFILSSLIVEGHAPIRPPKGHYGFASRPSSIALTSTPKGQRYSEEQFRSDHDTPALIEHCSLPVAQSVKGARAGNQVPSTFFLISPKVLKNIIYESLGWRNIYGLLHKMWNQKYRRREELHPMRRSVMRRRRSRATTIRR